MLRSSLILILGLLIFQKASAQTDRDTTYYFMKNSGQMVPNKSSADILMMIMPPNTNSGRILYPVIEVYRNGKHKLIGNTQSRSSKLVLEGSCLTFFPNGHRKSTLTYKNGNPVGNAVVYYPNGQLYASLIYDKDNKSFLMACQDSTGKTLTEMGEGRWPKFDDDFKKVIAEGPVSNGVEEGEWHGIINDTATFVCTYHTGNFVSGTSYDQSGKAYSFTSLEIQPTYTGGIDAFYNFLSRTLHYPTYEREKNITGKVFVTFVVEREGSLTGVKALKSPSEGLGEEAVRAIKLSPRWIPGTQYGLPVRVQYTVPVSFTLNAR